LPANHYEKLTEHTANFNKKNNDPYKKDRLQKRMTMRMFTTEELNEDE
jgi:hypothetical protein